MTANDISLIAGGIVLVIGALAAAVVAILKALSDLKKAAVLNATEQEAAKRHLKNVEVLSLVTAQKQGVADSELAIPIRDTPVAVSSSSVDDILRVKAGEVVKSIRRTISEETTSEPKKPEKK